MGFLNSTCSFTRFSITDPVPGDVWTNIPDLLRKRAFMDIDELPEVQAKGWVNFDDYLDTVWTTPPQKGIYITFGMRLDTRRIPAGVVRKHLDLALRKEKLENEKSGKKFISRERKKELKEQIMLKLRQRFLPIPGVFDVIWNTSTGEVWFASVQEKVIEMFRELFFETFDLHIAQTSPSELAVAMLGEDRLDDINAIEPTQFA